MNALLLTEYMKLELVDFPEPEIGPDDVLVRVRACGICGSDVHGFDGSSGRRNPPLIMGHEASGEVAKIGLVTLQAAKAAGCTRIIVVDMEDNKLQAALAMGATDAINPKNANVPDAVRALTNGRGADVAFECVGYTVPVVSAIQSVRKGGMVTLIGNLQPNVEIPLQYVVTRQIRLQGSCASNGEYPQCIDLMARGV